MDLTFDVPFLQSLTSAPAWPRTPRLSTPGLALVIGLHAAVVGSLLSLKTVSAPEPLTLMVQVLPPAPPPAVQPAPPKPEPPTPQPKQKNVTRATPVIAAETAAPTANEVARPVEKPVAAPSAPAAPVAISQPRFDADYLDNPAPVYPPLSRKLREEGKVMLRVFVEPDGKPGDIQLHTDSGFPRLNKAAQDAVARWKFVPAKRGQEPVGAWVLVPIIFSLRG